MTKKRDLPNTPREKENKEIPTTPENNTPTTNIKAQFDKNSAETLSIKEKRESIESKSTKLTKFVQRNKNPQHINHSIYFLLLNPFTLENAFTNLSRNKGAFTVGVNTGTIQGYSRKHSIKLAEMLKNKTYQPNPVRRIWIPQPGKKEKRSLGIPTFYDKVVQEATRGILESIYEPEFQEFSNRTKICNNFGFRPNKNCWDAITHFTTWGQKVSNVIEGDIKGAYDCVNHKILLNILSRRIKDKDFLNLIQKMLKAGIMDEGHYEHSIIGVPQGGILSPLLFNIYMFEFDKFIYNDIMQKHQILSHNQNKSNQYQRIQYRKRMALKNYQVEKELQKIKTKPIDKPLLKPLKREITHIEQLLLKTPFREENDTTFVYTRYADDWILGIGGNHSKWKEIKEEIELWLKEKLKLTLSPTKTKITNIRKNFVPFLGYEIILQTNHKRMKITRVPIKKLDPNQIQNQKYALKRTTSRKFYVRPNKERIFNKLKSLGIVKPSDLYPIGKRPWSSLNEFQIVQKYHGIYLGLLSHYVNCNTTVPMNRVSYIFQYSCAKTIAARKRITTPQVFEKYGKNLKITTKFKDSSTTRTIEFMGYKKIMDTYFKDRKSKPLSA
jgi:group II intron reverse transcriptase/maturase